MSSSIKSTRSSKRQKTANSTPDMERQSSPSAEAHPSDGENARHPGRDEGEEQLEEMDEGGENARHPGRDEGEEQLEEMDEGGDNENSEAKHICPFSRSRPGVRYLCDEFGDKGRKTKAAVFLCLYQAC
jgi:hypothetical protein